MLIDCTYYTSGYRHILNATMGTIPNPNAAEVCRCIEGYIEQYQEQFLSEALGDVASDMHRYLVNKDNGEPTLNPAYEAVCDSLREAFADYVYYHIIASAGAQGTINGLVRLKSSNTYISPARRQVQAWNIMVERMRRFATWAASDACPVRGIVVDWNLVTRINILNI